MAIRVHFGFAGPLNDFLRREFRGKSFEHPLPATATAKRCTVCRRVYWKGSHYERMAGLVARIGQAATG